MFGHRRTKGPHRLGRVQHVFTLEQAGDVGFPNRQRTQDQRTVRNGFVTRNAGLAFERAALARRHRNGCAVTGHGRLLLSSRPLTP